MVLIEYQGCEGKSIMNRAIKSLAKCKDENP